MKKLNLVFLSIGFLVWANPFAHAEGKKVMIVEPANMEKVMSPVKVCMQAEGLIVEPAKHGVHEGRGHHHVLFNSLPLDLSEPVGKDEIHLGDGSRCSIFDLDPGRHIVIALFADGAHVPYNPAITDKIIINVRSPLK